MTKVTDATETAKSSKSSKGCKSSKSNARPRLGPPLALMLACAVVVYYACWRERRLFARR